MGDMLEVLFSCAADDNQASCTVCDFRTSTNLMTYKGGGSINPRTLNLLHSSYVMAANSTKPLLHVWPINAQEQYSVVRFVVPGRVTALALSPDAIYLVAGIQETIYIWHLTSGRMLNTISKHYQTINCIRFTDDGSHFVTAGRDGGVLVWNLTQVVSHDDDNQTPLYTFNDHGLPVTDIHIGMGGIRANMMTVSLDRTCKIYDLSFGTLLLSVVFTEALHAVTSNGLETCVYVGSNEGNIYEFHIDSVPRLKEYHMEDDHTNLFSGHEAGKPVTCLKLSLDGQTLVSGAQDGQVCVWNIPSRQILKKLPHKGAVTNIRLLMTDPSIFNPEHKQPRVFGGNLRRMINPTDGAATEEAIEVLTTQANAAELRNEFPLLDEVAIRHEVRTETAPIKRKTKNQEDNSEEVAKLRAEIQHLKRTNQKLFDASTKLLFKTKK